MVQPLRMLDCKRCGTKFKQKNVTQHYCSRECYSRYYKEKDDVDAFPVWRCENCKKETQLEFNPVKEYKKLEKIVCPHCGRPRKETIV